MDTLERRWKTLGNATPNEIATDSANRVTDGQRRGGRGQCWQQRQSLDPDNQQTGSESERQTSEPAESAAREQQRKVGPGAEEFGGPPQLRAEQAAEDARERRIESALRKAAATQLPAKQPHANERAGRDEDTKSCDLHVADSKQHRVDVSLLVNQCPTVSSAAMKCEPLISDRVKSRARGIFRPCCDDPAWRRRSWLDSAPETAAFCRLVPLRETALLLLFECTRSIRLCPPFRNA